MSSLKYLKERTQPSVNLDVDQSLFVKLSSTYQGGAIYCNSRISLRINHCLMTNCYAPDRGGGIYCQDNNISIFNSCFLSNNVGYDADCHAYQASNLMYEYIFL